MCQALRELDIKSRAAESIVDDWQGSIVDDQQPHSPTSSSKGYLVRFVWKIDELVDLLLQGVEGAKKVPEICATISKGPAVNDGESNKIASTLCGFVESLRRLSRAIHVTISIIDMFKSQGVSIARSNELEESPFVISEIISEVERFSEDVGWAELDRQALPLAEFKDLAAYFLETGKA